METEQGTFTPLVYSTMGGMAPECERYTKHLSERIANKRGNSTQKQSATLDAEKKKNNYMTCTDSRIWVLSPVPLAYEASALPFELIPLDELQDLYQTSNTIGLFCL